MSIACVLTFHRIRATPVHDHDVSWNAFGLLLDRIEATGRRVVVELHPPPTAEGGPAVVLTFDDGTEDHARAARELADRGMQGIFFVPAGTVGSAGHLTEHDVHAVHELGHAIGSHAFHHAPLRGLSREAVAAELTLSREVLSPLVDFELRWFAPPGGISNPFLAEELERHGFAASRSMRWGLHGSWEDRWNIPCIPVTALTLDRGWVASAIERLELPRPMRAAWITKQALPARLRPLLRGASHARLRGTP